MNEPMNDVDAQIGALLDITDNNYAQAVFLVCKDIEFKEPKFVKNYLADGMARDREERK